MIKMKNIRPDIAKHHVLGSYISFPIIIFALAYGGIEWGLWASYACMAAFAAWEVVQLVFKTGTPSFVDWLFSSILSGFSAILLNILQHGGQI